jgi:hypothetical protein
MLGAERPEPCKAGRFGAMVGGKDSECSGQCLPGHFCEEGSTSNISGICRELTQSHPHACRRASRYHGCPIASEGATLYELHSCGKVQQRSWREGSTGMPAMPSRSGFRGRLQRVHILLGRPLPKSCRIICDFMYGMRCDSRRSLRIECHGCNAQHNSPLLAPLDGNKRDSPLQVGRPLEPVQRWRRSRR